MTQRTENLRRLTFSEGVIYSAEMLKAVRDLSQPLSSLFRRVKVITRNLTMWARWCFPLSLILSLSSSLPPGPACKEFVDRGNRLFF